MSNCEGCAISPKGQQINYSNVKAEATRYASEIKKTVAMWKEGFEVYYLEAEAATLSGKPIMEFIMYLEEE